MKKVLSNENVQAIVLLLLSIAETITMIVCAPISIVTIILLQFAAICGVLCIRFSHDIALLKNKWHSYFNRKNQENVDNEPSKFAIIIMKVAGYLLLVVQTAVPLIRVIASSFV